MNFVCVMSAEYSYPQLKVCYDVECRAVNYALSMMLLLIVFPGCRLGPAKYCLNKILYRRIFLKLNLDLVNFMCDLEQR